MSRRAPLRAEINVTPLIDVLLTLLAVFMLILPQARYRLDTALPEPSPTRGHAGARLVLRVEAESFSLDGRSLADRRELEDALREILPPGGDSALYVRAVGDVRYARVVAALDAATSAGVARLALLDEGGPRAP